MDDDLFAVLRAYPQIYFACHAGHRTRGSSPSGLTSHDASLLAHLDDPEGSSPASLARHLGVARSTLSAALARLSQKKLISIEGNSADRRRRTIRLTQAGRSVVATESVLDPSRLAEVLALMSPTRRRQAVEGLKVLAAAAREYREGQG
jgi:DNA-binding MarR family transcriptional regulator